MLDECECIRYLFPCTGTNYGKMSGGAFYGHHAAVHDENFGADCPPQGCTALITGESLGQVASQTIHAIACTDAAAGLPVFRPLIGMDKEEIVRIPGKSRPLTFPFSL